MFVTKRLNRIAKMSLFAILLAASLFLLPGKNVEAASTKTKALKAYSKLLAKSTIEWGDTGYTMDLSECKFQIIYLDDNSVPELLIYGPYTSTDLSSSYQVLLYTYKNGKAKYVAEFYSNVSYYKKKGIITDQLYTAASTIDYYYKFSGTKVRRKLAKSIYQMSTYYYTKYSGSEATYITKAKFNASLKKLVGSKKAKTVSYHKNTAANRKKYLLS
ncbi:MAG: hypothetical protein LUG99_11295 [Lachnospiraceae bacterium]|nr:hypothetical protein [Lachnospiraceae bacterium]